MLPRLLALRLVHVDLELFSQRNDLTGVEQKVGTRPIDVAGQFARVGSGKVMLESDPRVEARFDLVVAFGCLRVLIAEKVVVVVGAVQAEGACGVVTAGGAAAGLGAGRGLRVGGFEVGVGVGVGVGRGQGEDAAASDREDGEEGAEGMHL